MILIIRSTLIIIIGILISLFGIVFCLCNLRKPENAARTAHLFGRYITPLLGVKVETRTLPGIKNFGSCVYIANHQNNYDVLVAAMIVQLKTVTVGKRSLAWIPFFGQLYWLAGNILLNRDNKSKANKTIALIVDQMQTKGISIWMFPEGTRSKGRGLLPFKTGAFKAAIAAGVPIVPICVSNTNDINLSRINNGHMIVEMLEPISTENKDRKDTKELMNYCRNLMKNKIQLLDQEVTILNKGH